MKSLSVVTLVSLIASCLSAQTVTVMDVLADTWLSHARYMMNSTKNQFGKVNGFEFDTTCTIFMTSEKCTVVAQLGVIQDLSTITRLSPVILTDWNDAKAQVELDLTYSTLSLHYPSLLIQGQGVNDQYEGVDVKTVTPLGIKMIMTLDYSKGAELCTNTFNLTTIGTPNITATVKNPQLDLPLTGDMAQHFIQYLVDSVRDHIASFINYENVCTKLANLF